MCAVQLSNSVRLPIILWFYLGKFHNGIFGRQKSREEPDGFELYNLFLLVLTSAQLILLHFNNLMFCSIPLMVNGFAYLVFTSVPLIGFI